MTDSDSNLSDVKLKIKQVINNLKQLESYKRYEDLDEIKLGTEQLLNQLEKLPLERIKSKLNQRRRNRRNKTLQKLKDKINSKLAKQNQPRILSGFLTTMVSKKPKSDQQCRSVEKCQRFLQTFELLEQLYLLRGQNRSETYKFSMKLHQLKSIWNSLLQDKLQEEIPAEVTIQQQWNELLFGPPERTFFQEKPNLEDLLRRRQVWDSYIDSKYGSQIPIGWVVPKSEDNEQWRPYLVTGNV